MSDQKRFPESLEVGINDFMSLGVECEIDEDETVQYIRADIHEKEVERLRNALEFYAAGITTPVMADNGRIAREELYPTEKP